MRALELRVGVLRTAALFFLAVVAVLPIASADRDEQDAAVPRTLVVALDGVSYRCVQRAQEEGAFRGWPVVRPLVSTFPSMTNVAFAAIFQPFDVGTVQGYEMRHFDPEQNELIGGVAGYQKKKGAWRKMFQLANQDRGDKAVMYTQPKRQMRNRISRMEQLVLDSDADPLFVLFEATDSVAHFKGDEAIVRFLHTLSHRLLELERRHREELGRPLRIVMLSDHGNTLGKVEHADGILKLLEHAGFRVREQLEQPADIVAPTYGVCNFGLLFLRPDLAEKAARTIIGHDGVDIAAWVTGSHELRVISSEGDGVVRWRDDPAARSFAYEPLIGDPLVLADAVADLRASRLLDAEGFASEDDWLRYSGLGDYPDAPRRLTEALTGTYVRHTATVVFSLRPGFALGTPTVRLGAYLKGGKLEGTHGGLDRDSSHGFFLSNEPVAPDQLVLRADRALRYLATPQPELTAGSVDAEPSARPSAASASSEDSP